MILLSTNPKPHRPALTNPFDRSIHHQPTNQLMRCGDSVLGLHGRVNFLARPLSQLLDGRKTTLPLLGDGLFSSSMTMGASCFHETNLYGKKLTV